jgi:hypothetical protein
MTVEFALDYIPRRMQELGFGNNYLTRWRHFYIGPEATLNIDAANEFFMLITTSNNVKVKSKLGIYDLRDTGINEMQYEHRGKIEVTSLSPAGYTLVLFIQVIPTHKK